MAQDDSLLTTINSDIKALRAAVGGLWDTDTHPDTVLDAERLARDLEKGATSTNLTKVGDFFQLMAGQEHLDAELRQRAQAAFFLTSFCVTNADLVANTFDDETVDA